VPLQTIDVDQIGTASRASTNRNETLLFVSYTELGQSTGAQESMLQFSFESHVALNQWNTVLQQLQANDDIFSPNLSADMLVKHKLTKS